MIWSATPASYMRHLASHGYRFTLNNVDLNDNLSATTQYWTNLPNPYFDRDMDGFFKCIEAEVTSESASFPAPNTYYFGNFYYTYWYYVASFGGWQWNGGSGRIESGEQVSEQYGFDDKWDTTTDFQPAVAVNGTPSYPSKSRPANEPGSSAEPCQFDGGPLSPTSTAAAALVLPEGITGRNGDEPGELVLRRDRTLPLAAYRRHAHALAAQLIREGPGRGVVTFTRPLSRAELAGIDQMATVTAIEAVSDLLPDHTRATFGDAYGDASWSEMEDLSREEATTMLGVTSASVTIERMVQLRSLMANADVYLVDLSMEFVRRANLGIKDVIANDVFWEMAGWE